MNRHERRALMATIRADKATEAQLKQAVLLGEKAFPWLEFRSVIDEVRIGSRVDKATRKARRA